MYLKLKMKIAAMSSETRLIRHEIYRQRRTFNEMTVRTRLAEGGLTRKQIARILKRAKGRHLNLHKAGIMDSFEHHVMQKGVHILDESPKQEWIKEKELEIQAADKSRHVLRLEIRAALLAYNFLRGHHYSRAENLPRLPMEPEPSFSGTGRYRKPDWTKIQKYVEEYSSDTDVRVTQQKFAMWLEDAKSYRLWCGIVDSYNKENVQEIASDAVTTR